MGGTRQSTQIKNILGFTYDKQLQYCENDHTHPFMEDVVSVLSDFFENVGSFQSAYIFWRKFLNIQQSLFGCEREQMIVTYKKMAHLASQTR